MYNISDIKQIHLEITSKCQARCPMCPRRIQGGPMLPWISLEEITIDIFKKWFSSDFINQLTKISLCGNLGDPIIAKDTLPILQYLREKNSSMHLQMHTNGSARDQNFWQELAKVGTTVVFGLDGLEDTHSRYRIGTDFNKIIKNASIFISAGGDARWDMLVFDHNKHQVDECEKLAYKLGFNQFIKKNSSRFKDGKFHVLDDTGRTIDILYPTEKSKRFISKIKESQIEEIPVINCKAKKNNEIYVAANGNVSPCCWLDFEWVPTVSYSRIDYMDKIGNFPNLNRMSLEEIFNSSYFSKIKSGWGEKSCLTECKKQCGSFDKLSAQFEE